LLHLLLLLSASSHQVGVDTKAVADAWTRIEKKHGDKLAALFVSVDEGKGKALAYAGGWDTTASGAYVRVVVVLLATSTAAWRTAAYVLPLALPVSA
jgi:hypothetical protein